MPDNTFVKSAYAYFEKNVSTNSVTTNEDPASTWKKFESKFVKLKPEQKTFVQGKLPPQYDLMKESLVNSLDSKVVLSPAIVGQFEQTAITTTEVDGKKVSSVDMSKIGDKNAFIEKYLQYVIPSMLPPKSDFLLSEKVDASTVSLAVFGTLVGDSYFMEALGIGVISVNDYKSPVEQTPTTTSTNSVELSAIQQKKLSELTFAEAQTFAYAIFGRGPATDALIALNPNSPAAIVRVIALANIE